MPINLLPPPPPPTDNAGGNNGIKLSAPPPPPIDNAPESLPHKLLRRLISGPTDEEAGAHINRMGMGESLLDKLPSPNFQGMRDSISNKLGLAGYGSTVGTLAQLPVSALETGYGYLKDALTPEGAIANSFPVRPNWNSVKSLPAMENYKGVAGETIPKKPQLALPAGKPEPARFLSGPEGIADKTQKYSVDMGPLKYNKVPEEPVTVLPQELGEKVNIPPEIAANYGTGLGKPANVVKPVEEKIVESVNATNKAKGTGPTNYEAPVVYDEGKATRIIDKPVDYQRATPPEDIQIPKPKVKLPEPPAITAEIPETPKVSDIPAPDFKVPDIKTATPKTNKDAALAWATKLKAANHHRDFVAGDFKDLEGKSDLINAYQTGDRSGRLKDVDTFLKDLYDKEKAAGISQREKPNYLRQYWTKKETSIPANSSYGISQNPAFAKESSFPTYEAGIQAGFQPMYEDLPSILGARMQEHKAALANKEFYDYLKSTGQLGKNHQGDYVSLKDKWSFDGPHKQQLQRYFTNVTGSSWHPLDVTAQAVSRTKNIYLAGGIPGTPLNIHGYNIARSEALARGTKGAIDFAKGTLNPKADVETLERVKPLIRKAIDYGYQIHSENTPETELQKVLDKNVVGRAFNWTTEKAEKIFENPLFKRRLPAAKALVLEDNYNRLLKSGKTEEEALKGASDISNIFMGGMNKALRNKNGQNIFQTLFLAPDWAESRARLAANQMLSLIGKSDPIYAKSLARSGFVRGGIALGAAGLEAKHLTDKPNSASTIPLGKTASGKAREFPIWGTANEALRIPENAIAGLKQGDVSPIMDIVKNRLSTPTHSAMNLINNEDSLNRPLVGKDKYGKKIKPEQAATNILQEIGAPLEFQSVQALANYIRGYQGGEESISQSLELPVSYRSIPKRK